MAILPIRKFGDPVLREKSFPVVEINAEIKNLAQNLADTLHAVGGVGLAAPQIGVLKRVFVIDLGEGQAVYINPEIVSQQDEIEEEEGCLSVPPLKVTVKRFKKVKVKAQNIHGGTKVFEAEGLLAKAIQHEIDHINGTLILDRLGKKERRKALTEIREASLFLVRKVDDSIL